LKLAYQELRFEEDLKMAMDFEELDDITRRCMLAEFEVEELSGNPYRSKILSLTGLATFPNLMREAISSGNETTLVASLVQTSFWKPTDKRGTRVNVLQAAERLATAEFNTWYVRGLARRLLDEGVAYCQAYRASLPRTESSSCSAHEGQLFVVELIYNGHRAKYWPEPGNPDATSIPAGPTCHHTIRRAR
jgi:hypothetical protein